MRKHGRQKSFRKDITVRMLSVQMITLLLLAMWFIGIAAYYGSERLHLLNPDIAEDIADSVEIDANGKIVFEADGGLRAVLKQAPDLWFAILGPDNEQYIHGTVPAFYTDNLKELRMLDYLDVRAADNSDMVTATLRVEEIDDRDYHIFYGGARGLGLFFTIIDFSTSKMLPALSLIFLALAIGTSIAIPFQLRRSLAGLDATVEGVERIDIDRRGVSLATNEVPLEIVPLIDAINAALQRLDAGYRKQRRFLADAAHELKTPIAVLQMRLESHSNIDPALLVDAARLSTLAEQLLDMQRLEQADVELSEVDLIEITQNAVADLAPLAIHAGYDIAFKARPAKALIMGDKNALERVVTNLIQNAITHGGNKGRIDVGVSERGEIMVADSGPGVPADQREEIFEPFHRLSPTKSGFGLGLSLVREVVQRHAGRVTIADRINGGAVFKIRFEGTVLS